MRRVSSLMHTSEIEKLLNLTLIILVLIIDDIRQCEDVVRANVIFRTGPRGDLLVSCGRPVPARTTLVTPALEVGCVPELRTTAFEQVLQQHLSTFTFRSQNSMY